MLVSISGLLLKPAEIKNVENYRKTNFLFGGDGKKHPGVKIKVHRCKCKQNLKAKCFAELTRVEN